MNRRACIVAQRTLQMLKADVEYDSEWAHVLVCFVAERMVD